MSKPKSDYRLPAKCYVCGRSFLARYTTGGRAKACTGPDHKCQRGERNGRRVPCLDGCCRSKYLQGLAASAIDSAIDPRYVLDAGQFERFWKATKKVGDPEGIAIRFIAKTGCRLAESLLPTQESLEWSTGPISSVRIPTLKRTGRPIRWVHLSNKDEFTAELRRWAKGVKTGEPLFQVAHRTIQEHVERILEPIKPDRAMLVHLLRHTRASQLIAAGGDWNYVRVQLGWSRLEMAKRYVHTDGQAIAKVLEKI